MEIDRLGAANAIKMAQMRLELLDVALRYYVHDEEDVERLDLISGDVSAELRRALAKLGED